MDEGIPGTKRSVQRLKLKQTRELRLGDEILSIAYSPDERLLAVSTLDNTVKVFFVDSLKLFLTLYGHKLPVLSLSISSDSKLIATCSADTTVKLWSTANYEYALEKTLTGHQRWVWDAAFSADSAYLVTGE